MENKRLIAIVGAVAALVGGSVAVSVDYFLGERARVASEVSARRTEAYLDFISTKTRLNDVAGTLKGAFGVTPDTVANFCFNVLWQPEYFEALQNRTQSTKTRAARTCEEYFAVNRRLTRSRDVLTIYGSDPVLKSAASNDRAVHGDAPNLCTYLDMIVQMRRDNIDHSAASASNNDLIAIICPGAEKCFGTPVTSEDPCR